MDEDHQLEKALTEMPNILQELTLIQGIKHYFSALRQSRGHNPEGSPIDLEILVLLKLISGSVESPIQTLQNLGIIVVGQSLAINANFLKIVLSTCRSRINNSMKNLGWNLLTVSNTEKFEILSPLVDRKDARNWTMRLIPSNSMVFNFIQENRHVRHRDESPSSVSLIPLSIDGSNDNNLPKDDNVNDNNSF